MACAPGTFNGRKCAEASATKPQAVPATGEADIATFRAEIAANRWLEPGGRRVAVRRRVTAHAG